MHHPHFVIAPRAPTLLADIEATLARHPDADLVAAAEMLGMAPRSLQRALAAARTSFQAVRLSVRIALARRLLLAPGSKVDCVAREVGFQSTPHFVSWFRRHLNATPSGYRKAVGASSAQSFETPRGLRPLGVTDTRTQDQSP